MEFFTMLGIERQPTYDEYGKTAVECLRRRIQIESVGVPQLQQLWRETIKEVSYLSKMTGEKAPTIIREQEY